MDAGFLELVRYGIRPADDPIIRDSLRLIDAALKVDTPFGPCWHRYNHDCYGQRSDGGAYKFWGVGRAWPLLTGERGHYEPAAGHDPHPYLYALAGFSQGIGLIPEQVRDASDLPEKHLQLGGPTGSATPLLWAHAEVRSAADDKVFDLIEPVFERYARGTAERRPVEVWKLNRQVPRAVVGTRLRIQADAAPFTVNTMPEATLKALSARSEVGEVVPSDGGDSEEVPSEFAKHASAPPGVLRTSATGCSVFSRSCVTSPLASVSVDSSFPC